ncbi:MAG: hypothetical protein ACSHX0_07190 [Akkermansiaceae bacterium]
MMDIRKKLVAVLAVHLLITAIAHASSILLTEDFSYADGGLAANSSWSAHSANGVNSVQVSAGKITLDDSGEDVSLAIGSTMSTGDIWKLSFELVVSSMRSGNTYFAHFKTGGNGYNARVFGLAPVGGGDFTFGIGETTNSAEGAFATDFSFNQTYTLHAIYDYDTGLSSLTVDGVAGSISSTNADVGQSIQQMAFRQGTNGGTYIIDNAIVTAVPEPSVMLLLITFSAFLLCCRQRRYSA